jgi:hypothetical protein
MTEILKGYASDEADETEGRSHPKAGVSNGIDQPGLSMEENLHRIASISLRFEPGTSWAYSVASEKVLVRSVRGYRR